MRDRIVDVADHRQRRLRRERIDQGRLGLGDDQQVRLVDRPPAHDARAVKCRFPSSNVSSVSESAGIEKCCQTPGKSMNRRSTVVTSRCRICAKTSLGVTQPSLHSMARLLEISDTALRDDADAPHCVGDGHYPGDPAGDDRSYVTKTLIAVLSVPLEREHDRVQLAKHGRLILIWNRASEVRESCDTVPEYRSLVRIARGVPARCPASSCSSTSGTACTGTSCSRMARSCGPGRSMRRSSPVRTCRPGLCRSSVGSTWIMRASLGQPRDGAAGGRGDLSGTGLVGGPGSRRGWRALNWLARSSSSPGRGTKSGVESSWIFRMGNFD